ncbi:hypothetical protein P171DRAFT_427798 [Karstenula rhodostoma CBS 690.94]|uniref:Uncharacterized protein n=1 Tax=Karstenula rhodostoma CBS 690.94 TaxID=1392251 RepID=A0A9P4PVN3_9PLEO|nr:hypothetical protein P171DRAFT_427798 [Karstenula rhodostoma CBS 690.94]
MNIISRDLVQVRGSGSFRCSTQPVSSRTKRARPVKHFESSLRPLWSFSGRLDWPSDGKSIRCSRNAPNLLLRNGSINRRSAPRLERTARAHRLALVSRNSTSKSSRPPRPLFDFLFESAHRKAFCLYVFYCLHQLRSSEHLVNLKRYRED